jgi:formylmethanofuran dehydrogenase subunit D
VSDSYTSANVVLSSGSAITSTLYSDVPGVAFTINGTTVTNTAVGVHTGDTVALEWTVQSYFETNVTVYQVQTDTLDSSNVYIPIGYWGVENQVISDPIADESSSVQTSIIAIIDDQHGFSHEMLPEYINNDKSEIASLISALYITNDTSEINGSLAAFYQLNATSELNVSISAFNMSNDNSEINGALESAYSSNESTEIANAVVPSYSANDSNEIIEPEVSLFDPNIINELRSGAHSLYQPNVGTELLEGAFSLYEANTNNELRSGVHSVFEI